MIRGTVLWVNLSGVQPPEFGKTRPGLVVSNSEQNQVLDTVVIIPLSRALLKSGRFAFACRE